MCKSVSELEQAIQIKDEIISKLKNNLDTTIENFGSSKKTQSHEEMRLSSSSEKPGQSENEYTLGPRSPQITLKELVRSVQVFFETASDDAISQFLNTVKALCEQVERDSFQYIVDDSELYTDTNEEAKDEKGTFFTRNFIPFVNFSSFYLVLREPYFSAQSQDQSENSRELEYMVGNILDNVEYRINSRERNYRGNIMKN